MAQPTNRQALSLKNLGGRPRSEFRAACQAALLRGKGVQFVEGVLTGTEKDVRVLPSGEVKLVPPSLNTRLEAATWLADRSGFKPTVEVEVHEAPILPTGEEARVLLLDALPTLIATLPADRAELAKLKMLAAIQEAEIVLEGGE